MSTFVHRLSTKLSNDVCSSSHMKVAGMLDVSHGGINFGFWSHLRCSGQNAITFSGEGLV